MKLDRQIAALNEQNSNIIEKLKVALEQNKPNKEKKIIKISQTKVI